VAGYNADGAGIYAFGGGATVTLTNSTVSGNVDTGPNGTGGAITTVRPSLRIVNSIVTGNTNSSGFSPDIKFINYAGSATFTASHSIVGVSYGTPLAPAPVGSPDANGNLVGTFGNPLDARLGPLADNGGQTQTMALLTGSPAINAGDNTLAVAPDGTPLKFDQRGMGFQRIIDTTVDMGSFEFHFPSFPLVVTTAADVLHDNVDTTQLSLRDAVALANAHTGLDKITFAASLSGVPINLSLGELLITDSVQITGLGAKNTVIDAQHNSRVIEVAPSAGNVTLSALTVTGGKTTAVLASGGGILFLSPGVLTLSNVAVTNNSVTAAGARGAGIFTDSGAVSVQSSTISGNSNTYGAGDGGGIFSQNGAVTLTNSTLANNSVAGYNADGAGVYAYGAAATVTLTNSTVSGNVDTGPNGTGGAITTVRPSLRVVNSIISGNTNTNGFSPDIKFINYGGSATFTASHSIVGVNYGTPLAPAPVGSPDANGNLVGTFGNSLDAHLGPLADNGGQTQTMALLAGSPAINAGDNSLADNPDGTPLKTDQRGMGFKRIVGGTVDMGAFEVQAGGGNTTLMALGGLSVNDPRRRPDHSG
jgi:hypothetical protein